MKQTQEAEAFHIPLELELTAGGKPVAVRRYMTSKELNISVPLAAPPTMLRIDPRNAVLKEITEHKPVEFWRAQLTSDPNPVGRIDAAKALGKMKESAANLDALASTLKTDAFWAVRSEAAKVLGKLKGEAARDALLAGVKDAGSKVRRACLDALGRFKDDERVTSVIRKIALAGDESYNVEAAAISSYAKLDPEGAMPVINAGLERESRNEIVRSAAIRALGDVGGAETIEVLTEWTQPGKPNRCRQAAVSALASVAEDLDHDDAALAGVLDTLTGCLEGGGTRLRFAAARALGRMGGKADPALDKLRALAENSDGLGRSRRAIQRAIDAIEKDAPPQKRIAELETTVERLEAENAELKSTIVSLEARLEGKEDKAPAGADR